MTTASTATATAKTAKRWRRISLTQAILLGMVIGVF